MLTSHQVELGILRYTRVGASDEWRATTLPELANAVGCQDWNQVTDATKRLHAREVIRIRKWFEPHGFAFYKGEEDNISFFHRGGGFQLGITFEGRTYAESLEAREKLEAIASPKLGTAAILATETLDRNLASSFEVLSKV